VVPAGGRGERLADGGLLKQFRPLGGVPVLERSVRLLMAAGCAPVVVVVPEASISETSQLLARYEDIVVTAGGPNRQASVTSGLEEVSAERVVVHDAARPLATPELVKDVVAALEEAEGAIAAIPLDATLKEVKDRRVISTVDRATLWQIQTPQAFVTASLRAAHEAAAADGFTGTDDAMLLERLGKQVVVVPGSRTNLKLTYPEDFELAEAILAAGGAP
jgi:2-C-methyl-D-erythritol 4-phosphate cytidylyltransferase